MAHSRSGERRGQRAAGDGISANTLPDAYRLPPANIPHLPPASLVFWYTRGGTRNHLIP
jgi:hypothetical protein